MRWPAWYLESDGWLWLDGDREIGRAVCGLCNWYVDGDEQPHAVAADAADSVMQKVRAA